MAYNYLFKLLIIGNENVGKTNVCNRLGDRPFIPVYDQTIGVEFSTCFTHIYNQILVKCQLWDTSGKKQFSPVIDSYYRGVAGVILVYDISNRKSFDRLSYWLNEIQKNKKKDEHISVLILGNKNDKYNRVVSWDEANEFAMKHDCIFYETSAKENKNIYEAKKHFCRVIYDNYDHHEGHSGIKLPLKFNLEETEVKYDRDCCCCF